MTRLVKTRSAAMFVGGVAAVGAFALATASAPSARAAAGGRGLQVQKINVAQGSGVPANAIVEITMSQSVDPASVTPATVQVRGQNATQTGYTKQVVGSFQVVGNVIRFYPRLPTHLRDANGDFYPQGSPLDDAAGNAGFKPTTGYEVRLIGKPAATVVKSTQNKPLKNTTFTRFSTAAAAPPEKLWTTQSYTDAPPPQFQFSNPPDSVPTAATQYTTHGGTRDVPSDIVASLFCTKVPLAPGTVRNEGNVILTRVARKDDYSLRRPIQGSPFVEQNFDTTVLAFSPRVALIDLATLTLRVTKGVKDLTEQNDFAANRQRDQLRQIYDFLAQARALSPGVPASQFPDPPPHLITDWPRLNDSQNQPIPGSAAARGVLKTNILALGDAFPDEVDPRTMLIFTTRDELATRDSLTVEFTKAENIFDQQLSTGDMDTTANPSAAVATFTIAGGSAVLGDLAPTTTTTTISTDVFTNNTLNYRNVVIPQNSIVNFTGSRAVTVLAGSFVINGELRVDGSAGTSTNPNFNYSVAFETNSTSPVAGGPGGPGGGAGGTVTNVSSQFQKGTASPSGIVGNDQFGVLATAQDGGRGGLGGKSGTSTAYEHGGGGGGGGGMRTAGTAGASGTYPSYATWNGAGGAGGAAAIGNDDLVPMVGGAGGGGGASGAYTAYTWGVPGGGGGGGGGAITLQTSGTLTIGTTGAVRARGGAGGQGSGYKNYSAGPGGGGGGGSILLRSTKGYNIPTPLTQLDVSGGLGGTQPSPNTYSALTGGNGGSGLIRTEDPKGGFAIPGATQGTFDPVGAGVVSYVYTKWIDLGVQDPKILPWTAGTVVTVPQNDAIYAEVQMTTEHATLFGTPNLSAIDSKQNSTNVNVMSQWQPIKLHDATGTVGGAFATTLPPIVGLPQNAPTEYASFPVTALNGKGYRFMRFRVYFQLDSTQGSTSPLPFIDKITTNFEFNF